jgi:hypothetical protein
MEREDKFALSHTHPDRAAPRGWGGSLFSARNRYPDVSLTGVVFFGKK